MAISSLNTNKLLPEKVNAGLDQAGTWAVISDTPTGSYTDADGDWNYWQFTSSGTLNTSAAGLLDVFLISGGAGFDTNFGVPGGGGGYKNGIHAVGSGGLTVTVGAGGVSSGYSWGSQGGYSSIDSVRTPPNAPGITSAGPGPGIASSITGSSLTYGRSGGASTSGRGDSSATNASGIAGVVIVRRPQL